MNQPTRIEGGIEWYDYQASYPGEDGKLIDYTETECQCARCGSSAAFDRCDNCDDGQCEDDDWQNYEGYTYTCHWCRGRGGSWHCISSPEWCKEHPLPGREHIESTAMRPEAWQD